MTILATPAAFLAHRAKRAPLVSLFVVIGLNGCACVEYKRMTSRLLKQFPRGYVFSGYRDGAWVRRLGGGYCYHTSVSEVV